MKKSKILFIFGTFWETIKTLILFLLLINRFLAYTDFSTEYFLWTIPFVTSHLIFPICFLLLLLNEGKNSILIQIIRIGKIFILFSLAVIIFTEIYTKPLFILPFAQLLPLTGIFFFDLIFLYFLISYKIQEDNLQKKKETSSLPDYTITEVDNKVSEDSNSLT